MFVGFAFDAPSVLQLFAEAWLLGIIGGGVVAALFGAVGRRGG